MEIFDFALVAIHIFHQSPLLVQYIEDLAGKGVMNAMFAPTLKLTKTISSVQNPEWMKLYLQEALIQCVVTFIAKRPPLALQSIYR